MLRNYILIALRSFSKNKVFILINILGLGVAIACCIVAYLNWQFDRGWDRDQKNAADIYRVQFWNEFHGNRTRYGMSPVPLGNYLRSHSALVGSVVRLMPARAQFRVGDQTFDDQVAYADSAFFDLFTFDLLYGSFSNFRYPDRLIISDDVAIKYFGRLNVIGMPVTQLVNDRQKQYFIGGVFRHKPRNSSFYSEVFTLWGNYWNTVAASPTELEDNWGQFCNLFLQIRNSSNVPAVTAYLQKYSSLQNIARPDMKAESYYLENFEGMARRNRQEPRLQGEMLRLGLPAEASEVPAIMAIFLLLLACFNFTNTSIAVTSKRLKEIGLRKVMGSRRSQLIVQFMCENILLCLAGLICGLILAEFFVPAYNSLADWVDLSLSYAKNAGLLTFLGCILLFTAIFSGGYPAVYITSFNSISILRDKLKIGGTNWFTRILLGVQFSIAVLSIVFAVAFYKNAEFQKNYDLGFNTTRVISAYVKDENGYVAYRNVLSANPAITSIVGSRSHVANNSFYTAPVKYNASALSSDVLEIGDRYLETMDIKLIAGRDFQPNSVSDQLHSALVTEEFVKRMGWVDDPIGKIVVVNDTSRLNVIGVIKNMYARALWSPIAPMLVRYVLPRQYRYVIVKTTPGKMKSISDFMETKWKSIFPDRSYTGQRVDNIMAQTDDINTNVVKIFSFLGIFSVLLSLTGLYTLVSLNIIKRRKHIGIRRVLGASSLDIIRSMNLEFIIILSVASILGGLGGYFASGRVMGSVWVQFAALNLIVFLLTVILMVLLPLIITVVKTYGAAKVNPAITLRSE